MQHQIIPLEQATKAKEGLWDRGNIKFHASVMTISSYSFEARGLEFGMKIYLSNAVKVGQFFC